MAQQRQEIQEQLQKLCFGFNSYRLEHFVFNAHLSQLTLALQMLQDPKNQGFIQRHTNPADWIFAFIHFNELGILNDALRAAVENYSAPVYLVVIFRALDVAGCLSLENQMLVIAYPMPFLLTSAIKNLQEAGILTERTLAAMLSHERPHLLSAQFIALHQAELLTEDLQHIIADEDDDAPALVSVLICLKTANLLTPLIQEHVLQHYNPQFLKHALQKLIDAEGLNLENLMLVLHHPSAKGLGDAIECLHDRGLFALYRMNIFTHHQPYDLALALLHLNEVGLLTEQNLAIINAFTHLEDIVFCLATLNSVDMLTQENFDLIVLPEYQPLVESLIWYLLPPHTLQAHWGQILEAIHHQHIEHYLMNLAAEILHIIPVPNELPQMLNDDQSTHTASVHQSVLESVKRLAARYANLLHVPQSMTEIQLYLQSLDDNLIHQAAKNAITRLLADDTFKDPASGLSILELLALFWLAIHDEEQRQCPLIDACGLLVEALYEIQRGYNLNAQFEDDGAEDKPICSPGAFNKLIEKLQSIHPDVEIYFINKRLASLKLYTVVRDKTITALANPLLPVQVYKQFFDESRMTQALWIVIKAQVTSAMQEFQSVFNANDIEYGSEIEYGDDELLNMAEQIYQKQKLQQHGWFAVTSNTHASEKEEKSLDLSRV